MHAPKKNLSPASISLPLPKIKLASFLQSVALVLPRLIELIKSDAIRNHPVWGSVIPYHVPSFGSRASLGHCVRPDILVTARGPIMTEIDFVPSGRGDLTAGLPEEQSDEVLDMFGDWYRRMGVTRVRLATASTTSCAQESEYFASRMRQRGFDYWAINIDENFESHRQVTLVDRIFYRSEMRMAEEHRHLPSRTIITAEPYLDTKSIFALIHDKAMTEYLETALGSEGLSFLRRAMPESYLLSSLDSAAVEAIVKNRYDYFVKNTDVETDHCWGSRGHIVGASCSAEAFRDALLGKGLDKRTGSNPIVQRFHMSLNFAETWNGVIDGDIPESNPFGRVLDPVTKSRTTGHVGAKFGFYFLVSNSSDGGNCTVTKYGDTLLRGNPLVDYSLDSLSVCFQAT